MKGVIFMYNYFWRHPYNLYREQRPMVPPQIPDTSYVRILHASPDAPPVDIYINNMKTVSNLAYKDFTEYLQLAPGRYNVKVFPTGQRNNPVINTNVDIPPRAILTVAAVDKLENIGLLPIEDTPLPTGQGRAYIRFGHLSPSAPKVDIRLPNGKVIFENVEFKEVTDYISAYPGNYGLEVYVAGTDQRVLQVPNVMLKPNRIYTVYAVGLVGEEPPLEVLIPLDGNTYINV